MNLDYELKWEDSYLNIPPQDWNALVSEENPFLRIEFFQILEKSHSIGSKTTWIPKPLLVYHKKKLVGAIPLFLRYDSYGEYIFDFEWVYLFESFGIPYYPKLQSAIPFTPITSFKILGYDGTKKENWIDLAFNEMFHLAKKLSLSSIHILFHKENEIELFKNKEFSHRITTQYHWIQKGYHNFNDFLNSLKKEKRKSIRKERENIKNNNIHIKILKGNEIETNYWTLFYKFYLNTHLKKWGRPYLTKKFFELLFEEYKNFLVLVLATRDNQPIAGSLNFYSPSVLYGRYWGCLDEVPFLHFECCYYSLIEFAIENKISKIEAGAQGEHKFFRGFEAVPIHSSHFFVDYNLQKILQKQIYKENQNVQNAIFQLNQISPLKLIQ